MDEPNYSSDQTIFSWSAPEFTHRPKSTAWFVVLFIVVALFIVAGLLMKNYFFVLLVLMAIFLIVLKANRQPRQIIITITPEQINLNDELKLAHKEIISFWIFEEPEIREISLLTKKILRSKILLPLGDQDPVALRAALIKFVPEKKQEEPFSDFLARILKF